MPRLMMTWLSLRRGAQAAAVSLALTQTVAAGPIDGPAPYPASGYITGLTFDWPTFRRDGLTGDNWPTTWAANGNVYTSWGDGGGFGKKSGTKAYVSIGVARLTGNTASSLRGVNLISGLSPVIAKCFPVLPGASAENRRSKPGKVAPCYQQGLHGKSRSMLALDTTLYMFITPKFGEASMDEARLYKAPVETNNWQRASWAVSKNDAYPLVSPTFMQAGKNQADIGDHIYAYAARYAPLANATGGKHWVHRGPNGGEIVLMRAAKDGDLMQEASWTYFAGLKAGQPTWSAAAASSEPVFRDPRGVSFANTSIYVKALDRYLLVTHFDSAYSGKFGFFEAPDPWGPWQTIFYGTVANAAKGVAANSFFGDFLANSFAGDGTAFSFVFTGKDKNDALNVLDGRFTLGAARKQP